MSVGPVGRFIFFVRNENDGDDLAMFRSCPWLGEQGKGKRKSHATCDVRATRCANAPHAAHALQNPTSVSVLYGVSSKHGI